MTFIGIDPGTHQSGICVLVSGKIKYAAIIPNNEVYGVVSEMAQQSTAEIVIEDIAPYRQPVSMALIETAKFIGELRYRLKEFTLHFVPRGDVKYWVYEAFPEIAIPRVEKKMLLVDKTKVRQGKKGLRNKEGIMRKPSFNYVDDRIVAAAMKFLFKVPDAKVGHSNIYGLAKDSWQALGVVACFISKNGKL